eukprot:symbB.v1.2.026330.t1/scaffold2623.1/size98372/2
MVRFGRVLALSVSVIASVCLFWPREKFQWNLPSLASVNGSSLLRGPLLGEFVENASGEIAEIPNSQSETSDFSTTELKMLSTESQEFGTTFVDVISTSKLPEQMVVTSTDFQLDLPALPENLQGYCRCVNQGGHQPVGSTWYAEEEMKSLLSEMRDNLKIYLYPIKHHCKAHISQKGFRLERDIYELLSDSRYRVKDPSEANLFYIPTFVACWRVQWGKEYVPAMAYVKERLQAMLSEVATKFPFFMRYEGHRHFWVSTHDMGKSAISQRGNVGDQLSATLVSNGSCMVNTADDSEYWKERLGPYGFNASLDVPLVCNGEYDLAKKTKDVNLHGKRSQSVFFAGKWGGRYPPSREAATISIRKTSLPKPAVLIQTNKDGGVKNLGLEAYQKHMSSSDLCLAPRGNQVWSPRLFEFVWYGCIPVIVATAYHLPSSCFIDWQHLAILIEEEDANRTGEIVKKYLEDPAKLEKMRKNLFRVRHALMWHHPAKSGDAFETALLDARHFHRRFVFRGVSPVPSKPPVMVSPNRPSVQVEIDATAASNGAKDAHILVQGVDLLTGTYTAIARQFHSQRVFKKIKENGSSTEASLFLYYWRGGHGHPEGWWIANAIGLAAQCCNRTSPASSVLSYGNPPNVAY